MMPEDCDEDTTSDNSDHTTGKRVAKNTAILILLRVGIPLLSVLLLLVLARKLGTEGMGRYVLVYSLLEVFNTIGPLGLYAVITREGSRDHSALESILANAITMGAVASVLMTLAMIATGMILDYDAQTQTALIILSLAVLPYTVGNFLEGASVALEKMNFIARATLLEYALKIGIGTSLLLAGHGLESVLVVAVAGRIAGAILNARLLKRENIRIRFGYEQETFRKLVRLIPTFLFISIFSTLYWRIDILMLSSMRSIDDVGLYGAAYRIFNFALMVPVSLSLALYPQITSLMQQDHERLIKLGRIATRYMFAFTLPLAVGITLTGEHVLVLLFGKDFQSATTTVCVLAWALVPYGVVRYNGYLLLASDRQNMDLLINIIMSMLNILLNFLLIPTYGPLGAAIATLCSIVIYLTLQGLYIRRYFPKFVPRLSVPVPVVISCIVMGVVLWLGLKVHVVLALLAAPVAYLLSLILTRFFSESELSLLKLNRLFSKFGLLRFFKP